MLHQYIYPSYTAIRKHPVNLEDADLHLFSAALKLDVRATTVETLYNADIIKDIIFNRNTFRFDTRHTHLFPVKRKTLLKRLPLLLSPPLKVRKAVWIADEWSNGYFHWLTDALTRLVAAESLLDGHVVILPKKLEKLPFVQESLKMLGVSAVFCTAHIRAGELLLPGHTAPAGNYNEPVLNRLRDRLLDGRKAAPHRKIYISREKAPKRKVLNEDTVIALLRGFGYEIHHFEDYSFAQQVAIAAETKVLAGLHGAGLTNMLFMQPGGKVLELRNQGDTHNNCFFSQASGLGLDYFYLQNTGTGKDTHTADVTVDIEALRKVLEMMEA